MFNAIAVTYTPQNGNIIYGLVLYFASIFFFLTQQIYVCVFVKCATDDIYSENCVFKM